MATYFECRINKNFLLQTDFGDFVSDVRYTTTVPLLLEIVPETVMDQPSDV